MTKYWTCVTTDQSEYYEQLPYLSDPSIDLIEQFKKDIVTIPNPTDYDAYVSCSHIEKSHGHLLFILHSRVELIIMPVLETKELYFMTCWDNQ